MTDEVLQDAGFTRRLRNGRGYAEVWGANWDRRLHILRGRCWHIGVAWQGWTSSETIPAQGSFDTRREAVSAARAWFIDHPTGTLAELLADKDCPQDVRHMLHDVNAGSHECLGIVNDRLAEAGITKSRWEWVMDQLANVGIFPTD